MTIRRTLKTAVEAEGIALHAGTAVRLRLLPAEPGAGITVRRTDRAGATVPALWSNVTDTRLNTVLGGVGVIEHVMAALAGAEIDDCEVQVEGPEPPALDGASAAFLALIQKAGVREVQARRDVLRVRKRIEVSDAQGARASLAPASHYEFFFEIDFAIADIGHQLFDWTFSPEAFARDIAPARTFGRLEDKEMLHAVGLGRGASLDNTLVFDGGRLMNPEKQTFRDEFVRHKILDAIGDLKLAGYPLIGRFEGRRSGHALSNALLRALFADVGNYTIEPG